MSRSELYRPEFHFAPPEMWLNDPNGLVYFAGEYHLFYQYHPGSTVWGPMHWGHAVSRDLINWEHLPIALYPDENGMIFSGSAVIDYKNTAGFGKAAMVAVFTHHLDDSQSQSLAYSNNNGRTWTKYTDNPILTAPNGLRDFRDPKVFWYGDQDTGHWVMCLAAVDRILFYTSLDLIHWSASGALGPGYGSTAGVWETPELFELPVEGSGERRWILVVGVQESAPAGGSGTQYFVGHFDGRKFISENPPEATSWADFGADYYAAQSWNDEPNGRRLMVAWMNNWQYAKVIPAAGLRGAFSLIRELSLKKRSDGEIRLVHQPIAELQSLRGKNYHWDKETLTPGMNLLAELQADTFEIAAEFQVTSNIDQVGFHLRVGESERTTVAYDVRDQRVYIDRTRSGEVDFHAGFAQCHSVDLACPTNILRLHIFVDRSSVEVFAGDGLVVLTDCIFPSTESVGIQLFVEGGNVTLNSLDIFHLAPAMFIASE